MTTLAKTATACSARLSGAGLCCRGIDHVLQPAPVVGDGPHLRGTAGHTGFVAVATQVGYALGLLAFVPLGDVLERRGLMMKMYGTRWRSRCCLVAWRRRSTC